MKNNGQAVDIGSFILVFGFVIHWCDSAAFLLIMYNILYKNSTNFESQQFPFLPTNELIRDM